MTKLAKQRMAEVYKRFAEKKTHTFGELQESTKIPASTLRWVLNNIVRSELGILSDDNTRHLAKRSYTFHADNMNESVWIDAASNIVSSKVKAYRDARKAKRTV